MNIMRTTNTPTHCNKPGRLNPRNWSRGKQVTGAVLAVGVALGGWAAFRPENLFVNEAVNESFHALTSGAQAPQLIGQGAFQSLGHHSEGKATLYKRSNGYVLRFSDFKTSNGPDVHVYLVQGRDGSDSAAIKSGKYLDLGVIKGNIGSQNYALPISFDPKTYQSVSIWCKRFAVNFAAAPLAPGDSSTSPVPPAAASS